MYRICGIPGIIVAVILALTVKNKINTEAEASTSQTAKKKPGNACNFFKIFRDLKIYLTYLKLYFSQLKVS